MAATVRIRRGLLAKLREARGIPTIEHQARLIGVNRTTLQRLENGDAPSGQVMASICAAFGLGLGEVFEVVNDRDRNAA